MYNLFVLFGCVYGDVVYDGYGLCLFIVECGKIVFVEFLYGGKVVLIFFVWLIDGKCLLWFVWLFKECVLLLFYWKVMFKGCEWFVKFVIVG